MASIFAVGASTESLERILKQMIVCMEYIRASVRAVEIEGI